MKKIWTALSCLMLCMIFSNVAFAEEPILADKSVIFVIDTSGSMKSNDPDRLAVDSISQFIYSLPSDYKAGLVAYSAQVGVLQAPVAGVSRKMVAEQALQLKYEGYSDAGEGLSSAIRLLVEDDTQEKYIVMLSDGEILLENKTSTEEAVVQYKEAIQEAVNKGITVHVIGLGSEMADTNSLIFSVAEETGGGIFFEEKAQGIQDAVDTIRRDKFGVKQSTLAIVDADGTAESISAALPYTYADKIRILITCEKPVKNLKVSLQAESASQVNGSRYAVIEIDNPTEDQLEVSFEGEAGSRVWVNAIPEYYVTPDVSVEYMDTEPQDADPFTEHPYDRTAHITYSFASVANPTVHLWENTYFDHSSIPIVITSDSDERMENLFLDKGSLTMQEEVTEASKLTVQFDYSKLKVNAIGDNRLVVELEASPMIPAQEPEPEPPYLLIGIFIVCFVLIVVIIIVLIILWKKKRQKPIPLPPDAKPEPSKYSYVGKLNIYVTRTRSGYDIPPLSYDLFRLPAGKVISMYEVLDSCGVKERFPGAETIYLKAGGGRTLVLTNNSDCTIMKNREILLKTRSYQLSMDSKVDITFEDEISELAFHYKDVKLSGIH